MSMKDDVVVFALTANKDLVEEVCQRLEIEPGKIDVAHFADGEILVTAKESVRNKHVFIIQSTCKPVSERVMEVLVAVDSIKRASAKEITLITPYYGYARQDRKARARQPITSRLVADLLITAGIDRIVTMDLHAQQIQGFFNIPTDDLSAIPLFGKYIRENYGDLSNIVVVSPDHGGATRARNLAEALGGLPIAIIDKRRPRPNEVEVSNIIGDIEGKNCIVVDDLCDTAGSLCAGCNLVKEKGAKDVFAFITHGVFSRDALQKIENSAIKEMVITNTIPLTEEQKAQTTKIKVLSIGEQIAEMIKAVSDGTPVADVFDLYTVK